MRHLLLLAVLAAPLAAQQFVAELDPNPATNFVADPRDALAGNGVVYFTANSPSHGRELHVTNGTVAGTRVFADLFPGPQGSSARPLGVVGTSVVVQMGSTLRITDGTPAGTRTFASGLSTLTEYQWLGVLGTRFFWAQRESASSFSTGLYSSDGTTAGTVFLGWVTSVSGAAVRNGRLSLATVTTSFQLYSTDGLTLQPEATLPGAGRSGFASFGAHDYFLVDGVLPQTELWRTDGTTAGTSFVAILGATQGASSLATLGSQLVIGAANQLWTSDGTTVGTVPIASGAVAPKALTPAGSVLVFTSGTFATGGLQLWRTDGTGPGTFVLDPTPANYTNFAVGATRTFCFARGGSPLRLVRTDGTTAGTVSMPVVDNGAYTSLAALGSDAVATTTFPGPGVGLQAWRTDATLAGTVQLTPSTMPAGIQVAGRGAAVESTLFFPATTAAFGNELWRTDGTQAGTQLVQDFVPGPTSGVREVVAYRGAAWISSGNGIWRKDLAPGPSTLVLQPDPTATAALGLSAQGDFLLFRTTSGTGAALWRSDGTPGGTVQLALAQSLFQSISSPVQVGAFTYWLVQGFASVRLQRSDGTPTGFFDFGTSTFWMGTLGDRVLFSRLNGSAYEVHSIAPGATTSQLLGTLASAPVQSFDTGTRLVGFTNSGTAFATDGIANVTTLPMPPSVFVRFAADGFVYSGAYDPLTGTSLWRTDGTVAGTGPAIAFGMSGLGSVLAGEPLGSGNRILLDASDGFSGSEPWISQGTQATTALLADVEPNGNSSPQLIGIAGERAYFVAFDAVRGRELWSFDLAAVGAANAQPFGRGCAGTLGVPELRIGGIPAVGRTLSLRIERGAPSSIGMWFVGLGPQHLAVGGGCEFLMTTVAWSDWTFTDAAGAASTSLSVPNDPVFVGLPVVAQGSCLDPLGVSSFGTTVTEGVLMVIGG